MAQSKKELGTVKYQGEGYAVGDYHVPKPVIDAMRVVSDWMYACMFTEHTRWSYGNEHDAMADCRNFMGVFLNYVEEE